MDAYPDTSSSPTSPLHLSLSDSQITSIVASGFQAGQSLLRCLSVWNSSPHSLSFGYSRLSLGFQLCVPYINLHSSRCCEFFPSSIPETRQHHDLYSIHMEHLHLRCPISDASWQATWLGTYRHFPLLCPIQGYLRLVGSTIRQTFASYGSF